MTKTVPAPEEKIKNMPEAKLPATPLTKEEFGETVKNRVDRISREFTEGFQFIEGLERTVTFFGSARFKQNNPHYKVARELGQRVSERGIAIITGGGPGIMEAGNRGAYETNGYSIGLNIRLPFEQVENPYLTESMTFNYFFSRKVLLSYAAEAYVFFPGGFGTLDEFFEIVTLIQTHKIEKVPVILIGKSYWKDLLKFIEKRLYDEFRAIDKKDMDLYTLTDDLDEAMEIILSAPIRPQH